MTLNEIFQGIAVAAIVIAAVVWIIRKVRRRSSCCGGCSCGECGLKCGTANRGVDKTSAPSEP